MTEIVNNKPQEVDDIDYKILNILLQDAKMPYTDVAKQISVSGGTVHVRMKKLEELGIITGTTLKIDYSRLGYDVTCFIGIFLEKSSLYDRVVEELKTITEIVTIHYTTGSYNILIKIFCRDTKHLRQVLHDRIQKIEGIERTETFISLQESLERNIIF